MFFHVSVSPYEGSIRSADLCLDPVGSVKVHGRFCLGHWGSASACEEYQGRPLPALLGTDMPDSEAGSTHPTGTHSSFRCWVEAHTKLFQTWQRK